MLWVIIKLSIFKKNQSAVDKPTFIKTTSTVLSALEQKLYLRLCLSYMPTPQIIPTGALNWDFSYFLLRTSFVTQQQQQKTLPVKKKLLDLDSKHCRFS